MNAPPDRSNSHPSTSGATPAIVPQPPQTAPDMGAIVRRVLAHWQVIVAALLVGAIVTSQVVRLRKPAFKSETVIFYREGIGKSVTGPTDDRDTVRALGTKLKETLLAQQTMRGLIDEFHLYPDILRKSGYADAVDQMRKKTEFKSRSADTFAISFEGISRDEAQRVCARMAEILVAENAKRLVDDNRSATAFLDGEKRRADEELERIEREVSEFLTAHPEFAGARDGLGTEVIAQLRKRAAESSRLREGAGRGDMRRPRPDGSLPPIGPAVDPVLLATRNQAAAELVAARKELADRSLKFTEQHPDVRTAQARVAAAEASVKRADEAIAAARPKDEPAPPRPAASVEDPYGAGDDGAPKPKAAVTAAAPTPDPPAKLVQLEVEWTRLGRALSIARGRQADLEQKLYRAEMMASTVESGAGATIAVLDPAYKPSGPSNAPNKTVAMLGLALSIAVGLALSAAWGLFLDDRVFSANEIEGIVMVPVIGTVPREARKKGEKKATGASPKPRRTRA
jgi:uncharacterized protein involved in exopolysaccharide biosynthesis